MILTYMSTERQVADLLTKSLAKIAFERLRGDLTGYSCYNLPGNNIHAPSMRAIPTQFKDVGRTGTRLVQRRREIKKP